MAAGVSMYAMSNNLILDIGLHLFCRGCGFAEGPEECREDVRTIVFDKPEETCTLDPRDQRLMKTWHAENK